MTSIVNSEKNIYKYRGWTYKLENNKHVVECDFKKPDTLFKYYANNFFSRNAVINNYLFCSHPYHLNDSMDCNNQLWDFSNLTKNIFDKFCDYYLESIFLGERVSFEVDKANNFEFINTTFWNIATDKTGIISLSENSLDTLMWSHYSTDKGFMIEFNRENLEHFDKQLNPEVKNQVLMPIQYLKELEMIDFVSNNFSTPDIPFMYILNIKKDDWIYEKEWRLVCYSEGYGIPNKIMIPTNDFAGKFERKYSYEKESVKSITLGKYFFNGSNLIDFKQPDIYKIKATTCCGKGSYSDLDLINFIFENYNDRLYWLQENIFEKKLCRKKIKIKLEKLDVNTFKMYLSKEV